MTPRRNPAEMPIRQPIPVASLQVKILDLFANQWLLLTAGDLAGGRFNSMTIAWGSIGTMWNKPFVQVVVRPQRHTRTFLEQYETFTLCAFRQADRHALQLLGSKSGRDGNKIAESGLKPVAATTVAAPIFAEAELAIECRKVYWQDMNPRGFVLPSLADTYPTKDYHRIYFGEITAITGTSAYG